MFRRFLAKMVSFTGPGTALQEVLYGFIMSLIFVYAAGFGLLHFHDKASFAMTVIGMCLTWGVIDGIIFYYIWALNVRRYYMVMRNVDKADRETRLGEIMDSFSGTALEILPDREKRDICDMMLDKGLQSVNEFRADRMAMLKNSFGCVFFGVIGVVPVLLPMLFVDDFLEALGVSCILSALTLFIIGYLMGPRLGLNRFVTGAFLAGVSMAISVVSVFTGG